MAGITESLKQAKEPSEMHKDTQFLWRYDRTQAGVIREKQES